MEQNYDPIHKEITFLGHSRSSKTVSSRSHLDRHVYNFSSGPLWLRVGPILSDRITDNVEDPSTPELILKSTCPYPTMSRSGSVTVPSLLWVEGVDTTFIVLYYLNSLEDLTFHDIFVNNNHGVKKRLSLKEYKTSFFLKFCHYFI